MARQVEQSESAIPTRPQTSRRSTSRIDAVTEWRSRLTQLVCAGLLFEIVSGLIIYLAPFGVFPQLVLIVHTVIGVTVLPPTMWYVVRHWWVRRHGKLSHYQALGYVAAGLLGVCLASGVVVTWQGLMGPRMTAMWDLVHLLSSIALIVFVVIHVLMVVIRTVNNPDVVSRLRRARRAFSVSTVGVTAALLVACVLWSGAYHNPEARTAFSDTYNWKFGEDRPFAPSMAHVDHASWEADARARILAVVDERSRNELRASFDAPEPEPIGLFGRVRRSMDTGEFDDNTRAQVEAVLADSAQSMRHFGAIDARALTGSAGCGTSGCHSQIYEEWVPSAHRYSSMDDLFQKVQGLMAVETSPEHTRYCAGCHDPVSLFSGAKNSGNITLSSLGADEGISCLTCHSIVQADVQGNADYTIVPPERYVYEVEGGRMGKFVSDFLIRTYPEHHVTSYARPLYKTAEFCGACHKQYVDREVNTDIGKVQGQNQYDSWKNSRWYHEDDPNRTISCRECHMPLNPSNDPARGDVTDYNRSLVDGRHRSHRYLASNQYVPLLHKLQGAEEHVRLTKAWLRGEYPIPEIADKWTEGPVVRVHIIAPEEVQSGASIALRVILTNNKTGHDFPTGPLDMIESWLELRVTDETGAVVYHVGALDDRGGVVETPVLFKANTFDRHGDPIDRHNLWDLVGASYKRTMYPGVTDTVEVQFQCPSMARGRLRDADGRAMPGQREQAFAFALPRDQHAQTLHVAANLWYRKANPEFLDRVYGADAAIRSPVTLISTAEATIKVQDHGEEGAE